MPGYGGWGWGFYPGAFYPPQFYPFGGYGRYYGYSQPSPEEELNFLRDHLSALEQEIEAVRRRIGELESMERK